MPTLSELSHVDEQVLARATEWYRRRPLPAALRSVHPRVLARALRLAGGDARRIVRDDDLSVTVYNRPMW